MQATKTISGLTVFVTVIAALTLNVNAQAQERGSRDGRDDRDGRMERPVREVEDGPISYGGTGCPAGTLHFAGFNGGEAVVNLNDFVLYSNSPRERIQRKSCSLAIPLMVPENVSVALVVSKEGFVDLDHGTSLTLSQEGFFPGTHGPVQTRRFRGPVSDVINDNDIENGFDIQWSPCGQQTILRANINATMIGTGFAALDTLRLRMLWRTCSRD